MLVHLASPRNQMRCATNKPRPALTARSRAAAITAGLPSQAHIWLALTMPSACPAGRFSGPDVADPGGLPESVRTNWPAKLPPEL